MQITDELLLAVDQRYRPTLRYTDVAHPKAIILFSGPPSSGKSTVAKALEKHFQAVRLCNDDVRKIAGNLYPDSDLEWKSELSYRYMGQLRRELADSIPNGLWIIDANIDVHHQKLFEFAEQYGFKPVVLSMDIPEETRRQWIIKTGDRPWASVEKYLETMPLRKQQHEAFLAKYTPDLSIKPDYDIEAIFSIIAPKIA